MELTTTYFETVGKVNTDEVFRIVRKRVQELGIKTVLVASTGGDTAVKAVETLKGIKITAGTGRGADTAVVFRPVNSANFFSLRIKEILCKPYNPVPAPRLATPGEAPISAVPPQSEASY